MNRICKLGLPVLGSLAVLAAVVPVGATPDPNPPTVTCTVKTPDLWPPNHRVVDVGLSIKLSDPTVPTLLSPHVEVSVFADEDDEMQTGDGNFSPDAKPGHSFRSDQLPLRLRAERAGNQDGRVYLIVVQATDAYGNSSWHCCTVVVPQSNSKASQLKVARQAAAAVQYCVTHNAPPPNFVPVGDGPVVGPKQ
jgi:hypothetical protein